MLFAKGVQVPPAAPMTSQDIVVQLEAGPLPLVIAAGDRSTIARLLVELLHCGVVTTVGTRSRYMYVLVSREHERPSDQLS